MKKTSFMFSIVAMIALMLLSGCATIFTGTKSSVRVIGTPPEAKVYYN